MKCKLSDQDRQAVDLLLENASRSHTAQNGSAVTHAMGDLSRHVDAVEGIFALLDQLPAEEPPADLLSKTYARLSHAFGTKIDAPMHGLDQSPHA